MHLLLPCLTALLATTRVALGGPDTPSRAGNEQEWNNVEQLTEVPAVPTIQSQYRQAPRDTLTDTIINAKLRKNLTFEQLAEGTGLSVVYVTAALLGQHPLPAKAAKVVGQKLDLNSGEIELLKTIPLRGSIPGGVPTDPTVYRFYEMVQVYGSTLRALIHEQFGDGIISAINFKLNITKVVDPEGGHRAVITLDGKFLPFKPF